MEDRTEKRIDVEISNDELVFKNCKISIKETRNIIIEDLDGEVNGK